MATAAPINSRMKRIVAALGLITVVSVGFLAQSVTKAAGLQRDRDALAARLADLEEERRDLKGDRDRLSTERNQLKERVRLSAPTGISEELTVAAGTTETYRFTASRPGTLMGTWRSSGNSTGGADNTIKQFKLVDPTDATLEQSEYQVSSGRFLAKISTPGVYTLVFDNTGLFRSKPRRVFVQGEFRPN
jgi:hypothetical protein